MRISDPTAYAEWNTPELRSELKQARMWARLMEQRLVELTQTISEDIAEGLRSGPPGMPLDFFFERHAMSLLEVVCAEIGIKLSHKNRTDLVCFLSRAWTYGPELRTWWGGEKT